MPLACSPLAARAPARSRALAAAIVLAGGLATTAPALASDRFAQKVPLRPGLVAVVAEGDFEARSIGSYTVRVYAATPAAGGPADDTTFYAAGLLRPRDGTVTAAVPLAVAGRASPVLVVTITSVGTGSARTADAFAVESNAVRLLASVEGLGPNDDPVEAVRRQLVMGRL